MVEVVGFCLLCLGGVPLSVVAWKLSLSKESETVQPLLSSRPKIHPFIWIIPACLLMLIVGLGMYAIGNGGHYPGFPLDIIQEWLSSDA